VSELLFDPKRYRDRFRGGDSDRFRNRHSDREQH
jgi:hypothetical protein